MAAVATIDAAKFLTIECSHPVSSTPQPISSSIPELVALRLERFTSVLGVERVMAGPDCGFGTFAGFGAVDPDIAYTKPHTLLQGADILTARQV